MNAILVYDPEQRDKILLFNGIGSVEYYGVQWVEKRVSFKWVKRCVERGKILDQEIEDNTLDPELRNICYDNYGDDEAWRIGHATCRWLMECCDYIQKEPWAHRTQLYAKLDMNMMAVSDMMAGGEMKARRFCQEYATILERYCPRFRDSKRMTKRSTMTSVRPRVETENGSSSSTVAASTLTDRPGKDTSASENSSGDNNGPGTVTTLQ